jgi:hypothetical protein
VEPDVWASPLLLDDPLDGLPETLLGIDPPGGPDPMGPLGPG